MRLTTDRLVLTPFDAGRDWPDFVRDLVLDPVVTEHWADFADPALSDRDKERLAADEFLPWFEDGRALGLVVWVARIRADAPTEPGSEFVGVSGLMTAEPPFDDPDPEFGCLFATRWHGHGLASEASLAVFADAWDRLGIDRIITVMDSPNPASRRFVDRLGFRFDGVVFGESSQPYVRFVLDRPPTR